AVLLGFTPEAVGVAVRRALSRASTWQEYDWEIIHEGPISPNEHLALDQVLTEEVGAGRRGPTLRIWEWDQP
ncbi:lipoate--protein ligase family protein, partial [Bacillus sp. S34]|nr:lipoate--protein ligase family protein [Bacillus sp. S34]